MTYIFKGSPEDMMSSLFAGLQRASGESAGAEAAFHEALVSLVGLHHAQAVQGAADPPRLARFREESSQALLAFPQRLGFLVNEALILAEDASDYEWPRLCLNRSVIQFLIDDYAATPIPALIDRQDLTELDEEMARVGDRQGPLDEDQIPRGMPQSHWWWRYPQDEDEDDAQRDEAHGGSTDTGDADGESSARGTLVLDPQRSFDDLCATLAEQGWEVVNASRQPIVPGEPEHALFERAAQHLAYSFNPVCRLRLLEVPLDLDDATVALLPVQDVQDVQGWLSEPDERTQLRGILAAAHLPHPRLLEGVTRLHGHPRASIANAARHSSASIQATLHADDRARATALTAIEVLKQELTPLIQALASEHGAALAQRLRPQGADYARAFHPQIAEAARQAYEALWADPPRVGSASASSRLELHVAPAGMLLEDNELSRHFPGGYRAIAPLLDPHRVWVAWKIIAPGHSAGIAYDGLVWLDDHWAWFPKPYRALAHLVR
ncbi:hypothetical protein [Methylococcus sp. EFPC2]|uniref:hypothetical protein n=1 Tax=Methylococcus sp. EFPC2 TaxID=2812648 RepID=UPI0019681B43|nr:hypothetical protein [Methylococcus sp. EFPC2]QSA98410.1 hypothetical protein JWZ97_06270 [Methylococcus sp. EFPC2]